MELPVGLVLLYGICLSSVQVPEYLRGATCQKQIPETHPHVRIYIIHGIMALWRCILQWSINLLGKCLAKTSIMNQSKFTTAGNPAGKSVATPQKNNQSWAHLIHAASVIFCPLRPCFSHLFHVNLFWMSLPLVTAMVSFNHFVLVCSLHAWLNTLF